MKIRRLQPEVQQYLFLRQRLIEAFPRIDDDTLHDTLEGITTLEDLIAETIRSAPYDKPEDYVEALRRLMSSEPNIERLFARWEQNLATVRRLNRCMKQQDIPNQDTPDLAQGLVGHLKACAVALVPEKEASEAPNGRGVPESHIKIDKSTLAIAELKRVRSKEHLKYVARQPCLICGRQPSHAHHVRFAQPKGVGLKVSDEFTVPLCAIHHHENHTVGNERQWWQDRKLDPLMVARKLWEERLQLEQRRDGNDLPGKQGSG